MGTLYRRGHGDRRQTKWYGTYSDEHGKRRYVALAVDRKLAQQMLAKLERDVERRKAGVSDRFCYAASILLTQHLEAYQRELESRNGSPGHVSACIMRCRRIIDGCGLKRISDVTPEVVGRWLKNRRDTNKYFGIETSNAYLTAIKCFCRWLWTSGRSVEHHLIGLHKLNAEVDRRHRRRVLSDAELSHLLETTRLSKFIGKKNQTTGHDRYCIYLTAALTGLRAGELRSLLRRDVDLERSTISVMAENTKNGQAAMLPLHPMLASTLREYVETKDLDSKDHLFPKFWRQADMLKRDLKAAKVPYADADGRVFDFHALRGQFATMLARADVSLKKAQALMRHSTPTLTANIYTKLSSIELADAVSRLPFSTMSSS